MAKIIGHIIIIGVYFVLYLILHKMEKKNRDKIIRIKINNGNYQDAIKARKEIKKMRLRFVVISIVAISIAISTVFVITQENFSLPVLFEWLLVLCFFILILSLPILQGNRFAESMIGNIESETSEEASASKEPFYLFLRMFTTDDREQSISSVKGKLNHPGFSEYYFVKGLKKEVGKIYAVGDPTDVDAPYGAVRIYLPLDGSDKEPELDKWKEDILRLMAKAERIYVMIANTENCLWELEKALALHPQKTFFIVCDNNENDYNAIRKAGIGDFPDLSPSNGWFCHILQKNLNDNTWIITRHKKTASGYKRISNTSTCKLSGLRPLGSILLALAALALILFLAIKEYEKRSQNIQSKKEYNADHYSDDGTQTDSVSLKPYAWRKKPTIRTVRAH